MDINLPNPTFSQQSHSTKVSHGQIKSSIADIGFIFARIWSRGLWTISRNCIGGLFHSLSYTELPSTYKIKRGPVLEKRELQMTAVTHISPHWAHFLEVLQIVSMTKNNVDWTVAHLSLLWHNMHSNNKIHELFLTQTQPQGFSLSDWRFKGRGCCMLQRTDCEGPWGKFGIWDFGLFR